METPNNRNNPDRISYLELLRLVLVKRAIIGYTILFFLVAGLVVAITSPVEYESSAITLSEFKEEFGGLGQLGNLAGMAGINLPSGSSPTFSPGIYPDVIHSRAFLRGIAKEEFYFETKGQTMTLQDYYLEEKPGNLLVKIFRGLTSLPSRVAGLFSSDENEKLEGPPGSGSDTGELVKITAAEEYAIAQLRKRISIENNKQLFTLKVKSSEPLVSAQLNVIVLERLISYVSEYLTEKQRTNLEFIEQRTKEAEQKFMDSQLALASYRDTNQGIISQRARTREEFLQSQFNIAFNLYNSLKQQQEQAYIQLKKETPVFTTIEPAMVPLRKAEPKSALIVVISLFLGFFVGMGIVIGLILINFYQKTVQTTDGTSALIDIL